MSLDLDVGKVPACTWKHALKVAGKATTKTDSIEMTRAVFPEADAKLLTRVDEHHGRAEALLIAEEELAAFVYAATACRVFIRDGSRQYRHHIMTV